MIGCGQNMMRNFDELKESVMRNIIFLFLIMQLSGYTLFAQKYEMRINTGANLTFIPDFTNYIFIANDGLVIPGFVSVGCSVTCPLISKSRSETMAKLGFITDFEIRKKIGDTWKLSFSGGISQMRFDYDTYVQANGTPSVLLSYIDENHGDTNLLYVNMRPLNFSLGLFHNKFTLQFGPTFNFLIKKDYSRNVILYTTEEHEGVTYNIEDKVYFESVWKMKKILFGAHLRAELGIINPLSLFIESQYYINSIHSTKKLQDYYRQLPSYNQPLAECKPFQVQAGLSFIFWHFGKKRN